MRNYHSQLNIRAAATQSCRRISPQKEPRFRFCLWEKGLTSFLWPTLKRDAIICLHLMQGVWHIPHIYFTPFVSKYLIYLTSGQPWNTIVIIPYVCCFWHSSLPMLIATMKTWLLGWWVTAQTL